jgi:hypothetical protein
MASRPTSRRPAIMTMQKGGTVFLSLCCGGYARNSLALPCRAPLYPV